MGLITIGLKRFFDRPLIASIFVAILAFAVYANSLRNGFVMDDRSIFVDNPLITGDIESIFKSIDTTDPQHRLPYYRPFTYLTYYIEYRLHGLEPFWVRFSNISLHALNAFLVFWVARILIGNTYAAFFTAVLFAVHPINSEAVNFNSGGRNTMLACFFVLSSFLFFKKTTLQNSYVYSLVGGVLFLLGLFSKEFAICLLPILMVDEIFSILKHKDVSFKLRLLRLLPYLTALVVYLYMRWKTLSLMGIQTGIIPGLGTEILEQWYRFPDLETRILNNLYIIPRYLFNIIWPFYLSPKYYLPEDVFIHLHLIFLGLICLSIIIWFLFKNRNTVIAFGLIWTVFFWLPVSGLFIFSSEQMADRYLYAPLIGVWLIVGDLLTRKGNTLNRKILLGTVLLFFSIVTIWTNEDWESDITVFSRVIKKSPITRWGILVLGVLIMNLALMTLCILVSPKCCLKRRWKSFVMMKCLLVIKGHRWLFSY